MPCTVLHGAATTIRTGHRRSLPKLLNGSRINNNQQKEEQLKKRNKALIAAASLVVVGAGLTACGPSTSDARIANENLTTAADNFEIPRHIVGINGITDKYLFEVVGKCSINDQGNQIEVLCKEPGGGLTKQMMGLSDNVTYLVTQLDPAKVSVTHSRIIFKPESLIPAIELSLGEP